jgi:hypothetical protein
MAQPPPPARPPGAPPGPRPQVTPLLGAGRPRRLHRHPPRPLVPLARLAPRRAPAGWAAAGAGDGGPLVDARAGAAGRQGAPEGACGGRGRPGDTERSVTVSPPCSPEGATIHGCVAVPGSA